MHPTIRKATEGRTIAGVGHVYRFLAIGDDTKGKYNVLTPDDRLAIVPGGISLAGVRASRDWKFGVEG